jgi:hypothetical protein
MAQYKSVSQFIRRFKSDIDKSRKQAINRALTSARAEYVKLVKGDLGLKSEKLKDRVRFEKAEDSSKATMSIGTRKFFFAHDFKVKQITVNTNKGNRYGATYKVKTGADTFLPGSFVAYGRNSGKTIVLHRKADSRYPIIGTVVDVFTKAVLNNYNAIRNKFADSFKKNFESYIKYNNSK